MALKSNQTEQMAKKMQQTLQKLAPEFTIELADVSVTVKSAGAVIALIKMSRRSFDGFNIAYELSTSAGQGFPEHECFFAFKSDQAMEACVKISKAVFNAGCSEVKFIKTASAPVDADLVDANVSSVIPNDAFNGSIGA